MGRERSEMTEAVIRLSNEGFTPQEIARKLNTPWDNVRRILTRYNATHTRIAPLPIDLQGWVSREAAKSGVRTCLLLRAMLIDAIQEEIDK